MNSSAIPVVLSFLGATAVGRAGAEPLAATPPAGREEEIAISEARLRTIHAALIAFERKHHHWPDHLSDLVPDFLASADDLRDPADRGGGDLGSDQAQTDPKFRVSYSYERNANVSNGLACPLGPFPRPDIAAGGWGSWRLVNGHQETFWGDMVPVVRCYLHRPPPEERADGRDFVLNLTPSGRIYRSKFEWKDHPDSVDFMLRTLARDVTQGPGHVGRRWHLGRVYEYLSGCEEPLGDPRFAPLLAALAPALVQHPEQFEPSRSACKLAALFELKLGHPDRCLATLDRAAHFPGGEWDPITDAQRRAQAHHLARDFAGEIATYRWLLERRPTVGVYMLGLAQALESSGDAAGAAEWRAKADPGALLVGKPAPEFSVPLAAGGTIDLKSLRGQKPLLLNFWFVGCGPCRQEFPHLTALQKKHGELLEILTINTIDSADRIKAFEREHKTGLKHAMAMAVPESENPVIKAYHVRSCPTNFIVDRNGVVVWRSVGFGAESLKALESTLKKIGLGS